MWTQGGAAGAPWALALEPESPHSSLGIPAIMNADSGHGEHGFRAIVNTGSGQAERSSVAEHSWIFSLKGRSWMAASRLLMRRLRELLRLKYDAGLSHRAIAQACAVGLGTVTTYLQRATAAGLTWPLPDDLDDTTLEARVFARPRRRPACGWCPSGVRCIRN